MSSNPGFSLNPLLGTLSCSLMWHILLLTILISACWSATYFPFLRARSHFCATYYFTHNCCSNRNLNPFVEVWMHINQILTLVVKRVTWHICQPKPTVGAIEAVIMSYCTLVLLARVLCWALSDPYYHFGCLSVCLSVCLFVCHSVRCPRPFTHFRLTDFHETW